MRLHTLVVEHEELTRQRMAELARAHDGLASVRTTSRSALSSAAAFDYPPEPVTQDRDMAVARRRPGGRFSGSPGRR